MEIILKLIHSFSFRDWSYFLVANRQNKQQFISMLREEQQKANCETHHTSGDDLLIVQRAVQCSTTNSSTVLIGDDTDS